MEEQLEALMGWRHYQPFIDCYCLSNTRTLFTFCPF